MNYDIEKLLKESPMLKGYADEPIQMAFYSINCCWWTSFPEDLGLLPPVAYDPNKNRIVKNPGGPRLPCCPHCGSVLMQAPLIDFIESAKTTPTHYGKYELETFIASHERNCKSCFRNWERYDIFIHPFGV